MSAAGLRLACRLALALALAGCAGAPERSRAEREALEANRHAARAFEAGRLDEARSLYAQALKLDLAVENTDGIAVNLLSLARVAQAAGRPQEAHAALDRVLDAIPPAAPARQAEAAARKAQLFLGAGQSAPAAQWSERAGRLCAQSGCSALASILNLRAMAALREGDPERALSWSRQAMGVAGTRAEHANALRVSAEAHLARREPDPARQAAEDALALDRSLGLPPRVYRDLMLLGRSNDALGRRAEARAYYQRALTVAGASDDADAVREARAARDAR